MSLAQPIWLPGKVGEKLWYVTPEKLSSMPKTYKWRLSQTWVSRPKTLVWPSRDEMSSPLYHAPCTNTLHGHCRLLFCNSLNFSRSNTSKHSNVTISSIFKFQIDFFTLSSKVPKLLKDKGGQFKERFFTLMETTNPLRPPRKLIAAQGLTPRKTAISWAVI